MNDFHKIWIDQCEAAEGIREQFGVQADARYLIGEKLLRFMDASHEHPKGLCKNNFGFWRDRGLARC